jgi:hypothetical protein
MPRSEWICNTCGKGFETKGKRDNHREREHRGKTTIVTEKERVKRSENGKFICKCGRDYLLAPSLRRLSTIERENRVNSQKCATLIGQ